jgi:hypothetical protein
MNIQKRPLRPPGSPRRRGEPRKGTSRKGPQGRVETQEERKHTRKPQEERRTQEREPQGRVERWREGYAPHLYLPALGAFFRFSVYL